MAGVLLVSMLVTRAVGLPPIESVNVDQNRSFTVNGEPFFPIMIWLQDPENFPKAQDAGINTVAGYWPGSGGTKDVVEYVELVKAAGLYGVPSYHEKLHGHPSVLGYIHDDEPDLPHQQSDARVVAGEALRVNRGAPLWKIVDGTTHTWSVLDPLQDASFTIERPEPVTVHRLGVWLTISPGLAVAREVSFSADGKEIATATLKAEKGRQGVPLAEPVSLTVLTVRVDATYPGENVWGSIGEIEGFDAAGKNVLVAPPRNVPRTLPQKVAQKYGQMRRADASRPVFMTVTGNFLPFFDKWTEEQRAGLYPAYAAATDVLGFDIYPIYGWGRPDWLHLVRDGAAELRRLAGNRPTYAWIETSKGSQWVSDNNQVPVTAQHIRAEVWMTLCQGAKAIGYFTHIWKPSYAQFGVPPENVAALRQINDQITRLTRPLVAPASSRRVSITIEGNVKADIRATEPADALYLFAVNYDPACKGGPATIRVSGLEAGTRIEVVDEGRTLQASDGQFTDRFEPLEVHIYRVE